jgi:hypothetical protein
MMSYLQEPLRRLRSTLNLPTAPEDPMPGDTVPSGVGQQQLIPHDYTETLNDVDFENTSPGAVVPGAFGEMSDDEWTGRLHSDWNGTYAYARASAAEAIGDPYAHAFPLMSISRRNSHLHRKLSAWPKYLQLELVVDSEISTLDIQAWIRQTKAPVVRLEYYPNGTDKCYFDNLVVTLRNARGVSFCSVQRVESMTRTHCPSVSRLVRNCEMGESRPDLGATSHRAAWQSLALCRIPRGWYPESADAQTATTDTRHKPPRTLSEKRKVPTRALRVISRHGSESRRAIARGSTGYDRTVAPPQLQARKNRKE